MTEMKIWRWLGVVVLTVVVVLVVAGGALVAVAKNSPFLPGQGMFAAQSWAENVWAGTMPDATALANYRIDLAERRLDNLSARTGTPWELAALRSLDSALDQALLAVRAAPASASDALHGRLLALANHLQAVLENLIVVPAQNQATYLVSMSKVDALKQAALPAGAAIVATPTAQAPDSPSQDAGLTATVTPTLAIPEASIDPQAVLFPPNATPGMHDLFPLTGKHTAAVCADCHTDGNYRGTTHECAACHAKVLPAVHYPGVCSLCHSTSAWKPASFNHTGAKDCLSCHTKDEPANHFAGQCSRCHTTVAWLPANMDHTGLTNCISCHAKDKPANHWPGQCSGCHTTKAWKPPVVNHSLFSNLGCDVCHRPPANHFPFACAACHKDTTNWKNVQVDHSLFGDTDCVACHQPPANHYPLPCHNCHKDTTNWKNVQFDHSFIGNMDCSVCHPRPANHFGAPCTTCHHDTTNWHNVQFNHPFPMNHGGANGNCAVCHPDLTTSWTCTACHSNAAMDARHAQVNGYSHNCIQCHSTGGGGGD